MKGRNCGFNCKHFHGSCFLNENNELKFTEFCEKYNDKFKEFNEKYGDKNSAWVAENIIMECFEPSKNTKDLDTLDNEITNLLDNF
jgi:hypothetical protein